MKHKSRRRLTGLELRHGGKIGINPLYAPSSCFYELFTFFQSSSSHLCYFGRELRELKCCVKKLLRICRMEMEMNERSELKIMRVQSDESSGSVILDFFPMNE